MSQYCSLISLHLPVFSEPPVEFCPVPQEELHKSSMELDPVVLLCHVSAEDAEVTWYIVLAYCGIIVTTNLP